jgi:hypothetical protein
MVDPHHIFSMVLDCDNIGIIPICHVAFLNFDKNKSKINI